MSSQLERGRILYEQGRWQQALECFQEHLSHFPEDADAYCSAARCCLRLEYFGKASEYAETAIAVSPDFGYAHYIQSSIYFMRNLDEDARRAIGVALELEPTNPDFHAMLARLHAHAARWADACDAADTALGFDPSHAEALTLKAHALVKLSKYEEARGVLQFVLENDPENTGALIEMGNLHLYLGDWKEALGVFQDALAIDPESKGARAGFMDALRTQYPLYSLILRYFLWMNRFSRKHQQAMQYGLSVLVRLIGAVKKQYPALAPFLGVLLFLWRIFTYLSWTIRAGTTMLLRFNKYGRNLVDRDEVLESNIVGGLWLAALGCWLYHSLVDPFTIFCRLGMVIFMTLPVLVGGAFSAPSHGWPKYAARSILGFMGATGIGGLFLYTFGFREGVTLINIYAHGFGIAALVLAYLEGVEAERS